MVVLSDSLSVRKVSGSSSPHVEPVRHRTVASPSDFGLLKTSGEGVYRRWAAGTKERWETGCLCVLPDREGMLDRC